MEGLTNTDAVRAKIDLSTEVRDRVAEYASNHGLRMSRAYAELIRAGLESETDAEEIET